MIRQGFRYIRWWVSPDPLRIEGRLAVTTISFRLDPGTCEAQLGFAHCSPGDNFNKRIGRKIARGRLDAFRRKGQHPHVKTIQLLEVRETVTHAALRLLEDNQVQRPGWMTDYYIREEFRRYWDTHPHLTQEPTPA